MTGPELLDRELGDRRIRYHASIRDFCHFAPYSAKSRDRSLIYTNSELNALFTTTVNQRFMVAALCSIADITSPFYTRLVAPGISSCHFP